MITLIQQGKVGDIIRLLPAVKYLADKGNQMFWLCPEKYHPLFEYVAYVKPVTQVVSGSRVIDTNFGIDQKTRLHREWLKRRPRLDSFLTMKYEIMGVPISEVSNLQYERNLQKEIELWDMVYPRTNYILVHGASDYGTSVEFEGDNVVEFYPIEGYTIFDWRKIIENADEIHCIDSSLVNFVDCLDVEADLNYYITDKVPLKGDRTILTKKWNIINKL
jgi:hypothetical protein